MALLQTYYWPGNVRELEYFVEKVLVQYDVNMNINELLRLNFAEHRKKHEVSSSGNTESLTIDIGTMRDMRAQILEKMFHRFGGNQKQIALFLNLSRATVWKSLRGKQAISCVE
jgi:transcriptional regulator with PAS, ATPase and Fis domain